jgi:hypothetical protein
MNLEQLPALVAGSITDLGNLWPDWPNLGS